MKNFKYNILSVLCVIIFAGSFFLLLTKLISKQTHDNQMESVMAVFDGEQREHSGQPAPINSGTAEDPDASAVKGVTFEEQFAARSERLAGYRSLYSQNSDMKGWVTISGTKVDYPVMQSPDRPDFYLKHGFDKNKSIYGTPYISEKCDLKNEAENIIIYGHHMKDGSMFAGLMEYESPEFYKNHPVIWFDTLDEAGAYLVIGALKSSAKAEDGGLFALAASTEPEARIKFIDEVKRLSFYDTGQTIEPSDRLLVLITCEYTQNEGRLLVVAKEVRQ